jgi:hypothetical protein
LLQGLDVDDIQSLAIFDDDVRVELVIEVGNGLKTAEVFRHRHVGHLHAFDFFPLSPVNKLDALSFIQNDDDLVRIILECTSDCAVLKVKLVKVK